MLIANTCVFLLCAVFVSGESLQAIFRDVSIPEEFIKSVETRLSFLSEGCNVQMKRYMQDLWARKLWALQMFDSGSKIPTGIFKGNMGDLGVFDQCLEIDVNTEDSKFSHIEGKYCIGDYSINLKSTKIPAQNITSNYEISHRADLPFSSLALRLATCLPSGCSATDIQKIYSISPIMNKTFSEYHCQTKSSGPELDGLAIGTIAFFVIIAVIMIASTVYDVFLYYTQRKPSHILLIAFSVFSNGKKILATSNSPQQISCLHGIRTISIFWVILGHRFKTMFEVMVSNRLEAYDKWLGSFVNSYLTGAAVAVDTFFLMSGLVISYSFMNLKKRGGKLNIPMYYLHRYLRLTPAYAAVILIYVSLAKHLSSGPQWPQRAQEALEDTCRKWWWSALLYVQNYVNSDEPCMGQTWYLSVDTQLFLLSPLLLIPFYKWPKIRIPTLVILTLATSLAAFFISYFEELYVAISFVNAEKGQRYVDLIYYPTHTRAAAWLIGLGAGYIIFAMKNSKLTLFGHSLTRAAVWVGALAVMCACVFGSYVTTNKDPGLFAQASYTGFISPAWAIGVCCVIFICEEGYGGPVNWLLSNPLMQVISKLTYSMYITHKFILSVYIYSARTPFRYGNFLNLHSCWGDFIFTMAMATFWVLAFESPIIIIEKVLFHSGGDAKKPLPAQANGTNVPVPANDISEDKTQKMPV